MCVVLLYDQYCTVLVYRWYGIAKMYQQCLWLFCTVEYVDMKSAVPIVKYSNSNGYRLQYWLMSQCFVSLCGSMLWCVQGKLGTTVYCVFPFANTVQVASDSV